MGRSRYSRLLVIGCILTGAVALYATRDALAIFQPIPATATKAFADGRTYVLVEDVVYTIGGTNVQIRVPKGFVTDLASIPQIFWSTGLSPTGRYSKAAIVHDYLYWTQLCTRKQADNLLMIAMKESLVSAITRYTVYYGVRIGGGAAWDGNAKQRLQGLPHFIPADRLNFGPQVLSQDYRLQLKDEGARDPTPPPGTYCSIGEKTDVPGTT